MCSLPGVCVPFSSQGKCSLGNRQNSELWWKSWDSLFVVLVHCYCLLPGAMVAFWSDARLLLHRSQGGILPSLTLVILRSKLWISWHMGIFLGLAAMLLAKQPMLSLMAPFHLWESFQIRWMFRCCFAHQLFSLAWLSQFPYLSFLCAVCSSALPFLTLHYTSFAFSALQNLPCLFLCTGHQLYAFTWYVCSFPQYLSSYMSILALFWVEWALMCNSLGTSRTDFILYLNIW